jgi:membrane protein YqaA with SNARE-associated domain
MEIPMRDLAQHSPVLLCLIIVVCGAMASLVPVSPVEPVLIAVAAIAPVWLLPILVLLATASHMATKTLVFLGGAKVDKAYTGRHRARFDRARERLAGRGGMQRCALFLSSVTGLPPFYVVTALCGSLKMPLRHFLIVATTGRTIRFAALIFLPQLFRAAPLAAQTRAPAAVTVSGPGPETFVLISGVVVAGNGGAR